MGFMIFTFLKELSEEPEIHLRFTKQLQVQYWAFKGKYNLIQKT